MADQPTINAQDIRSGEDLLPLIKTLENSGDQAISKKGAVGAYQILPSTAREMGVSYEDMPKLADPEFNRRVAGQYLNKLYQRFGNVQDTLAAYNAGPTRVAKWIAGGRKPGGLPVEAQGYVQRAAPYIQVNNAPLQAPPFTEGTPVSDEPTQVAQARPASGLAAIQKGLDAGFSPQEMDAWKQRETQRGLEAGFTANEMADHFGETEPSQTPIHDYLRSNLERVAPAQAPHIASNPLEMLAAGWGMSVTGLATNQAPPKTVLPEHAAVGAQVLAGAAQLVGDLPAAIPGFMGGAAAGSEVPGIGNVVGGFAGAAALPQAMREIMLDYYRRGEVHSFRDFAGMAGQSLWNVGKSALSSALMGKAGEVVGKVAEPVLGSVLAKGADLATQAATAATTSAALDGRVPDASDFASAAILTAGTAGIAGLVTRGAGKPELTPEGKQVKTNLEEVYKQTGIPPWVALSMASSDKALFDELVAEDPSGRPALTNWLKRALPEPDKYGGPEKATVSDTPQVPAVGSGDGGAPPKEPGTEVGKANEPGKEKPNTSLPQDMYHEISQEFYGDGERPKESDLNPGKLYRQWVSELGPARAIDKILLTRGFDLSKQLGLEDMFRQTYASDARVGYFIYKGGLDPITFQRDTMYDPTSGKDMPVSSVMDAIDQAKKDGGNLKDWTDWMVWNRALDKSKQGLETGHPLTPEQLTEAIKRESGKYENATRMLQSTLDSVLDYGRESGVFNQKQVDAMRRDNPIYISFRRIMGDTASVPVPSKGRGFKVSEPVSRFEGDDRQIRNPLVATIDNMHQIVRMADRNRAIGSAVTLAKMHGLLVDLGLKRIEGPEIKATIAEPGSDVFKPYLVGDTGSYEPFLAQRAFRKSFDKNTFLYINDGKAELWHAESEDLAQLMRGADSPGEANIAVKLFQGFAQFSRAGIVVTPDFPAKVTMRHQITAFIADRTNPPPFVSFLRGAWDAFGQGDRYWDWVGRGGAGTSLVELDKNVIERNMQQVFEQTGVWNSMWNTVKHPLEAAQIISERMDASARIGYDINAQRKGVEPIKAATMGRKAMLDYVEKGTSQFVQYWARSVPFMRPHILGLKQFGEAIAENPLATMGKAALAVTMPTVVLNVLNYLQDEYGDLPESQQFKNLPRYWKDGMYILPQVGGIRLRIPYPFVVGVPFGGLTTRFMDRFLQDDKKAFEDWGMALLSEIIPPFVPSLILPPVEAATNTNFFTGHKLIPARYEDASGPMQYTENTTAPAKALAKVLPSMGKLRLDSPIALENYVRGWMGSAGMFAMRAVDATLATDHKPWEAADMPFVNSFLIRNPGTSAEPIHQFYEERGEFQKVWHDKQIAQQRALAGSAAGMDELTATMPQLDPLGGPNAIAQTLNRMQGVLEGIDHNKDMTVDEKRQNTDALYGSMIELARSGLVQMRAVKAAHE